MSANNEGKRKGEVVASAAHTILTCWEEWNEIAGQEEQQAQDQHVWLDSMGCQLEAVIEGAIDEAIHWSLEANSQLIRQRDALREALLDADAWFCRETDQGNISQRSQLFPRAAIVKALELCVEKPC